MNQINYEDINDQKSWVFSNFRGCNRDMAGYDVTW